jgi:hypothetical protein
MPTLTLAIGQAPATPIRDAMIKEAARVAIATWPAPATQAPPPQRNWAARHPVLLGTLIGTGVGLTWVAVEGCSSSDYTCSAIAAFAAGTGALLGAVGGLVVALALP